MSKAINELLKGSSKLLEGYGCGEYLNEEVNTSSFNKAQKAVLDKLKSNVEYYKDFDEGTSHNFEDLTGYIFSEDMTDFVIPRAGCKAHGEDYENISDEGLADYFDEVINTNDFIDAVEETVKELSITKEMKNTLDEVKRLAQENNIEFEESGLVEGPVTGDYCYSFTLDDQYFIIEDNGIIDADDDCEFGDYGNTAEELINDYKASSGNENPDQDRYEESLNEKMTKEYYSIGFSVAEVSEERTALAFTFYSEFGGEFGPSEFTSVEDFKDTLEYELSRFKEVKDGTKRYNILVKEIEEIFEEALKLDTEDGYGSKRYRYLDEACEELTRENFGFTTLYEE